MRRTMFGGRTRPGSLWWAALWGLLLCLAACGPAGGEDSLTPTPSEPASPSVTPSQSPTATPTPAAQKRPFALAYEPDGSFNPLLAKGLNRNLLPLVFQGLFSVSPSLEAKNELCSSYQQELDGLCWRFTLRRDVSFSDGTPLSAARVVECLNAARESETYRVRLADISQVREEEGTVVVELSSPNGALPVLLDTPIFYADENGYPVGTGPYRFDDSTGELRLSLSPYWTEDAPPVRTIPLKGVRTDDERITAFDTGEVTLVDAGLAESELTGYSASYESWDYITSVMLYLGFQTRQGPCQDTALRRAVSEAIDRTELVRVALTNHADPATVPAPPGSPLYEPRAQSDGSIQTLYEGNFRRNQDGKLLWKGKQVTIKLLVNRENLQRTGCADALAQMLSSLGLEVQVSKLAWGDYVTALAAGDFDLYLGQVKLTADLDPGGLLVGDLNYGGFESASVPDLLTTFRASSGDARKSAARALYNQLDEEVPFVPLCFVRGRILTQWGTVSGLTPAQENPFYGMENWVME